MGATGPRNKERSSGGTKEKKGSMLRHWDLQEELLDASLREGPVSDFRWQVWLRLAAEHSGSRAVWMQGLLFKKNFKTVTTKQKTKLRTLRNGGPVWLHKLHSQKLIPWVAKVFSPMLSLWYINILCFDGSSSYLYVPRGWCEHGYADREATGT